MYITCISDWTETHRGSNQTFAHLQLSNHSFGSSYIFSGKDTSLNSAIYFIRKSFGVDFVLLWFFSWLGGWVGFLLFVLWCVWLGFLFKQRNSFHCHKSQITEIFFNCSKCSLLGWDQTWKVVTLEMSDLFWVCEFYSHTSAPLCVHACISKHRMFYIMIHSNIITPTNGIFCVFMSIM